MELLAFLAVLPRERRLFRIPVVETWASLGGWPPDRPDRPDSFVTRVVVPRVLPFFLATTGGSFLDVFSSR